MAVQSSFTPDNYIGLMKQILLCMLLIFWRADCQALCVCASIVAVLMSVCFITARAECFIVCMLTACFCKISRVLVDAWFLSCVRVQVFSLMSCIYTFVTKSSSSETCQYKQLPLHFEWHIWMIPADVCKYVQTGDKSSIMWLSKVL